MSQIAATARRFAIGVLAAAAAVLIAGVPAALAATIAPPPSASDGQYALLTPSIQTLIKDPYGNVVTTPTVGTTVHPWAKVTGSGGTPTGSMYIYTWHNLTCSGTAVSVAAEPLSNGVLDAYYLTYKTNDPASVSYRHHYVGNATYAAADGPCVGVTFTKATPTVQLQLHDAAHHPVTSVSYGTSVHGYVEVGGSADVPTGTASITRFPTTDCSGFGSTIGPVALAGDGTLESGYQWTFSQPGTWSFRASYQGDSTYVARTSNCVTFTVTKATPTFVTALHDASHSTAPASVMVGDVIHAYALLTSTVGTPTGSVKAYRYADATCTLIENPQTITAATTMDPAGQALTQATPRTESWRLTYLGDTYFNQVVGPCLPITWQAAPSITAGIHNAAHALVSSVVAGSPIHLDVSVSGSGATPTGQVTFRFSTANDCDNPKAFGTKALSGGTADDAAKTYTPASAGTYSFEAVYAGDSLYTSIISSCQVLTVTPAPVPTGTPKPTAAPTATPAAPATPAASASTGPTAAPSAAPSDSPAASAGPDAGASPAAATPAPVASDDASTAPAAPAAGDTTPVAAGTDGSGSGSGVVAVGLILLLLIALMVWRWVRNARRRQQA